MQLAIGVPVYFVQIVKNKENEPSKTPNRIAAAVY